MTHFRLSLVCRFLLLIVLAAATSTSGSARAQGGIEALKDPNMPLAYQRVLSLPEGRLHDRPQGRPGEAPPIFSILYLYGQQTVAGEEWLQVGRGPLSGPTGWIREKLTQQWKHSLVLQFARRGANRGPAMFFGDEATIRGLASTPSGRVQAESLLRIYRSSPGSASDLRWVEPEARYNSLEKPYLLPIIKASPISLGLGDAAVLAKVASVNTVQAMPLPGAAAEPEADMRGLRIGLVFVVDTSLSMQPYIQRVQRMIDQVYTTMEARGLLDRVSFGLVGFRAAHATNPRLQYTTRIYQPLELNDRPQTLLRRVSEMAEARAPTPLWQEDAYAGLSDALLKMDWKPFRTRLVVLVSDAGPLPGDSPYIRDRGANARVIRAMADARDIAVFPVHLVTPEAQKHDYLTAGMEYRELGETGDPTSNKYIPVDAGSPDRFADAIKDIVDSLVAAATRHQQGRKVERRDVEQASGVSALVFNEIFRSQFEYLASAGPGVVPRYEPLWTVDTDLTNPPVRTMEPHIFLTRSQLNGLAQATQLILERAKSSSLRSSDFYRGVQNIAAGMSAGTGNKAPGVFDDLTGQGLLPGLLQALPYHSQILSTSGDVWRNQSATMRQQFIDDLERKLAVYAAKDKDDKAWMDLGGGDRRDNRLIGESTLLPLRELP